MTGQIDRTRLGVFVGALVALAAGFLVASELAEISMITLAPAYMFTPLLAGAVACLVGGVSFSTVGLRLGRPRWLAAAAAVSFPLVALTLALSVGVPGVAFDPTADPVPGLPLPSGALGVLATLGLALALGVTINGVFALGEEFGWRGYLLWELAPLGFWRASLVVGAVWGVWHAPVIVEGYNYPAFPTLGVAMMTAACISFSPVYTHLVVRAESVLAAAVLHGVFNGSAGLVVAFAVADDPALSDLVASPVGVAGILAFGLAAVAIAVRGAPPLTRGFAGDAGAGAAAGDRISPGD